LIEALYSLAKIGILKREVWVVGGAEKTSAERRYFFLSKFLLIL
jgi:hypothetical protein